MKIQTVNQLISVFKDISTRHYQINGFGIGDEWEIGASKAEMHPVLWINPVTATMPESDNGYKTFEIDFEVRVFDLVSKGETNENDVLSDCIDILKDIITEFKGHPYYVNSQLNIIDDISFEAFTEEFDEEVSGWVCEISLMTPILNSFCGIPAADITGFEFPGTDCPEVNVLCPVFVEDVTGVYPVVVNTVGTTKEVSIAGGGLPDTFVVSGVYDTGTLTLTRNDAVDVVVTGFASGGDNDYTTAATLSGNIITFDRTDTVGAYSVDLTSAINSAPDKFVSSGAFDDASKLLTLTLNDATDFDVDFSTLTTADKFVSSGAYDEINNKIVLTLNDATTVDIDTSAIGGGGDSIYTADGTITGNRIVDSNGSTLNFQNSGVGGITTFSNSTSSGGVSFIVEGRSQLKSKRTGGTILEGISNTNNVVFSILDDGQAFFKKTNGGGATTFLSIGRSSFKSVGTNPFRTTLDAQDSSGNVIFKVGETGNAVIGGSAQIGSEDISLQGSTLIKGIGTSGSSALAIYDNDTTPNKLWDFLDNGNIELGSDRTFDLNGSHLFFNNGPTNLYTLTDNGGHIFDGDGGPNNLFSFRKGGNPLLSLGSTAGFSNVSTISFRNGSSSSNDRIDIAVSHDNQMAWFNSAGTEGHRIRYGNFNQVAFFMDGDFGWKGFCVGGNDRIGIEDISLQGDTLLNAKVSMPNLPTSATGLATGDLWNDGGTLKIA